MTTTDILAELPNLPPEERRQVFTRLCELEEVDLLNGAGPTEQEKKILDQALADYAADGDRGKPWREVLRTMRPTRQP